MRRAATRTACPAAGTSSITRIRGLNYRILMRNYQKPLNVCLQAGWAARSRRQDLSTSKRCPTSSTSTRRTSSRNWGTGVSAWTADYHHGLTMSMSMEEKNFVFSWSRSLFLRTILISTGGRSLSFYHGRNCSMTYNHLCSNSYAQSYITSTRFNSEKEHLLLKGLLIIDKIQICEIPTHHIDCNRHFSLTELTSSSSITRYENREQHIYYGLIHDVLRFTI